MIRRKDSFGYIDFMRGKYQTHNVDKIQQLINEMSVDEKTRILTTQFSTLWQQLWGDKNARADEMSSMRKFDSFIRGSEGVSLLELVQLSNTNWEETEWEFPKGRRNCYEKDIDCALREFEEETGYSRNDIEIVENVSPYEEIFIGSNNKSYKHKYFLAKMQNPDYDIMPNHQQSEVSKTEWKTLDNCLKSIRSYSLEKKKIIESVSFVIGNLIIQ
jgi:8-oxo-dGTP pyrophosphatase MutT (NUDIX family)